jgi:CubicO group peptidase (beta-lactamase class C family)
MDSEIITKLESLIARNACLPNHTTASSVLQHLGTPTVSLAVLSGDKITTHCITAGSDNDQTLFQACSISKPVSAVLVFKLIEEGKLSLHAAIADYLPKADVEGLETEGTKGMAKFITISQLLSHTSGLESASTQGFPGYDISTPTADGDQDSRLPQSLREILSGTAATNTLPIRLLDFPGHRFNYSGGGFTVLQLLVETITSTSLPELMQQYIFNPLRMTRSSYRIPNADDLNDSIVPDSQGKGNYAKAYYNGHTPCEVPQRVNPEQSAAGLWTTPHDLLLLTSAISSSLHNNSTTPTFLPRELTKEMLTQPQNSLAAHGWFTTATHFGHGGSNMPGYRCHVSHSLSSPPQQAIAVMTNSAEGVKVFKKVVAAITHLLQWQQPLTNFWYQKACTIPFADVQAKIPFESSELGKWVGGWKELEREWKVEFDVEKDSAYLQVAGMEKQKLWIAAHGRPSGLDKRRVVVDLVCNGGLEILVRLMVDDGDNDDEMEKPMMELWNASTGDVVALVKL